MLNFPSFHLVADVMNFYVVERAADVVYKHK